MGENMCYRGRALYSSATENIIMEVPQKIQFFTFSATIAYNGISIIIFFKAPALECIFYKG